MKNNKENNKLSFNKQNIITLNSAQELKIIGGTPSLIRQLILENQE